VDLGHTQNFGPLLATQCVQRHHGFIPIVLQTAVAENFGPAA
jgi:hypothetical protein